MISVTNISKKDLPRDVVVSTDSVRLMQMVGSFAGFERSMIRERTRAGLAAARAEGRIGGRRPKLKANQRTEMGLYAR